MSQRQPLAASGRGATKDDDDDNSSFASLTSDDSDNDTGLLASFSRPQHRKSQQPQRPSVAKRGGGGSSFVGALPGTTSARRTALPPRSPGGGAYRAFPPPSFPLATAEAHAPNEADAARYLSPDGARLPSVETSPLRFALFCFCDADFLRRLDTMRAVGARHYNHLRPWGRRGLRERDLALQQQQQLQSSGSGVINDDAASIHSSESTAPPNQNALATDADGRPLLPKRPVGPSGPIPAAASAHRSESHRSSGLDWQHWYAELALRCVVSLSRVWFLAMPLLFSFAATVLGGLAAFSLAVCAVCVGFVVLLLQNMTSDGSDGKEGRRPQSGFTVIGRVLRVISEIVIGIVALSVGVVECSSALRYFDAMNGAFNPVLPMHMVWQNDSNPYSMMTTTAATARHVVIDLDVLPCVGSYGTNDEAAVGRGGTDGLPSGVLLLLALMVLLWSVVEWSVTAPRCPSEDSRRRHSSSSSSWQISSTMMTNFVRAVLRFLRAPWVSLAVLVSSAVLYAAYLMNTSQSVAASCSVPWSWTSLLFSGPLASSSLADLHLSGSTTKRGNELSHMVVASSLLAWTFLVLLDLLDLQGSRVYRYLTTAVDDEHNRVDGSGRVLPDANDEDFRPDERLTSFQDRVPGDMPDKDFAAINVSNSTAPPEQRHGLDSKNTSLHPPSADTYGSITTSTSTRAGDTLAAATKLTGDARSGVGSHSVDVAASRIHEQSVLLTPRHITRGGMMRGDDSSPVGKVATTSRSVPRLLMMVADGTNDGDGEEWGSRTKRVEHKKGGSAAVCRSPICTTSAGAPCVLLLVFLLCIATASLAGVLVLIREISLHQNLSIATTTATNTNATSTTTTPTGDPPLVGGLTSAVLPVTRSFLGGATVALPSLAFAWTTIPADMLAALRYRNSNKSTSKSAAMSAEGSGPNIDCGYTVPILARVSCGDKDGTTETPLSWWRVPSVLAWILVVHGGLLMLWALGSCSTWASALMRLIVPIDKEVDDGTSTSGNERQQRRWLESVVPRLRHRRNRDDCAETIRTTRHWRNSGRSLTSCANNCLGAVWRMKRRLLRCVRRLWRHLAVGAESKWPCCCRYLSSSVTSSSQAQSISAFSFYVSTSGWDANDLSSSTAFLATCTSESDADAVAWSERPPSQLHQGEKVENTAHRSPTRRHRWRGWDEEHTAAAAPSSSSCASATRLVFFVVAPLSIVLWAALCSLLLGVDRPWLPPTFHGVVSSAQQNRNAATAASSVGVDALLSTRVVHFLLGVGGLCFIPWFLLDWLLPMAHHCVFARRHRNAICAASGDLLQHLQRAIKFSDRLRESTSAAAAGATPSSTRPTPHTAAAAEVVPDYFAKLHRADEKAKRLTAQGLLLQLDPHANDEEDGNGRTMAEVQSVCRRATSTVSSAGSLATVVTALVAAVAVLGIAGACVSLASTVAE